MYYIGEKVKVVERCCSGEVFEWYGVITMITEAFIETKHSRNAVSHPMWHGYNRAYSPTWTKHYGLDNIKKI